VAKGKGKKGGKQKDYNAYSQKKEDNFSKARRYKCNKCKEFGHKASDCKQLIEDKGHQEGKCLFRHCVRHFPQEK
jgi:hypothetical protein